MRIKRVRLSNSARRAIIEREKFVCHICGGLIQFGKDRWEVSHEIPLALGGEDTDENRRAAHHKCHRDLTYKEHAPAIAKSRRIQDRHRGVMRSRNPIRGWRKFDGTPVKNPRTS